MATNDQWERLVKVVEADQTGDEKLRAKVLAFGKKIGLENPEQLFQIREGRALITWDLALRIHQFHLSCDPYLLMGLKQPSVNGSLIGAWTYRYSWVFRIGLWEIENRYFGNYEEYLFMENNTVDIVSQNNSVSVNYSFDPKTRHLRIGKQHYYVSRLDQKNIELISQNGYDIEQIQLDRIPDGKLHIIPKSSKEESDESPAGTWLLDKEFSRGSADENWIETYSCSSTRFTIWSFSNSFRGLKAYKFGQIPRDYGIRELGSNNYCLYFGKDKCFNVHIASDGKNGFWLSFLADQEALLSDSLKKYHFVPWDYDKLEKFDEIRWWVVNQLLFGKNADKFPLEYLELWHHAADETATVFDTPNFLEYLDNHADVKYSGAYAFAHAFTNSQVLRHNPEEAGDLYRQFLRILDMWLQLRKKGRIVKYIRLFAFSNYPEYIKTLQEEIDRMNEESANE